MSQHPIDDFFSRKLNGGEAPGAPMHLWEAIDEQRDWKHKLLNQVRLRWLPLSLTSSGLTLIAVLAIVNYSVQPIISHFPIPTKGAVMADITTSKEEIQQITNLEESSRVIPPKKAVAKAIPSVKPVLASLVESAEPTNLKSDLEPKLPTTSSSSVVSDASFPANSKLLALSSNSPNMLGGPIRLLDGLFGKEPECAKFKKGEIRFYLDLLVSPDLTFRQLDAKNPIYTDYAASREATETLEYTFSTGARISAVSGFGLALRTGVNYSQINEKFEYVNETETITRIIRDANGVPIDTFVETGARYKTTFNKYRTLDIPILLGYEIDFKNLVFAVNGGAYVNLIFNQKGDFLSPQDLRPVNFSSNNPDAFPAFKNRLGLGWYGSVSVQYQLKPNLHLLLEPHFKMYPKSVTQPQYIVDQRYFSTGLFVGVRHQL